jgi:lipooligosaccharide transport system permease protein
MLRMVEREWIVWRRLWRGALFQTIVTPLLFLAAMGLGLGSLVNKGSGGVGDLTYLEFVTPGLMAASAMLLAGAESLWPVMMGTKWYGTYHAAVSTPLRARDLFGGHVVWTCARTAFSSTIFLVVAAILGGVPSPWGVLAIPAAVLGAAVFAAGLNAYAVTQESDIPFAVILRVGLMPLFMFSGTFFPVTRLPDWLRPFTWLSPLWHSVELCRAATTGGGISVGRALVHVVILVAAIAACWAWGIHRFQRALTS